MKNRLSDLNNHLFAQLERLADEGLTAEQIEKEVKRADAIVQVADTIVDNARLQLTACKLLADHGDRFIKHLPMLGGPDNGAAK
jgi:glycerol-3-phosphate dehydrogenase